MLGEIKILNMNETETIDAVYDVLRDLEKEYPSFERWYYSKVVPGLAKHEREVYVYMVDQVIAAVMILKNSATEKKICTLRVRNEYQKCGIGSELIRLAQNCLKTDYPVITVSKDKEIEFKRLFEKFGFNRYKDYDSYYRVGKIEVSYNGPIEAKDSLDNAA